MFCPGVNPWHRTYIVAAITAIVVEMCCKLSIISYNVSCCNFQTASKMLTFHFAILSVTLQAVCILLDHVVSVSSVTNRCNPLDEYYSASIEGCAKCWDLCQSQTAECADKCRGEMYSWIAYINTFVGSLLVVLAYILVFIQSNVT